MISKLQSISDYVWFYYNQGFSIIPLGKNRENNLKAPSLSSWDVYKTCRPTKKEIQAWLDKGLFVGIGIICGKVSGNLAVIDFDDKKIPNEIELNLIDIGNQGNWVAQTGRGYHIYCKGIKIVNTRKAAIVSMDLKAEKGYVVAPPSLHENGNCYVFTSDISIPIPKQDVNKWFDELVKKIKKARNIKVPKPNKPHNQIDVNKEIPPCIKIMLEGAEQGRRNETLFALASFYKNLRGLHEEETLNQLHAWNARLAEPLESEEFSSTINSAYNSNNSKGCSSIRDLGYCPYSENFKKECPFFTHVENQEINRLLNKYEVLEGKKGVNCNNLLTLIKESEKDFHLLRINGKEDGQKLLYYYRNGVFVNDAKNLLESLVKKYLPQDRIRTCYLEEVYKLAKSGESYEFYELDNADNLHLINVNNGVLNIETMELLEHSPKYRFLHKIPINYINGAKSKKWKEFLKTTFVKNPDSIDTIQEIFGACLYHGNKFEECWTLFGDGANGKGVITSTLQEMLGKENCAEIKLGDITNSNFAMANLIGKLANVAGETGYNDLKNCENLKELLGGDLISAEIKYGGRFQFRNYATIIFSTNKVVLPWDKSIGMFRRLGLITFLETFEKKDSKTNINLKEELAQKQELEGILYWSVQGLKRLLNQGYYSHVGNAEDKAEKYMFYVNFEESWLLDNIEYSNSIGDTLTLNQIYVKYSKSMNAEGYVKTTKQAIRGILKGKNSRYLYQRIREERKTGGIYTTYLGCRWKNP